MHAFSDLVLFSSSLNIIGKSIPTRSPAGSGKCFFRVGSGDGFSSFRFSPSSPSSSDGDGGGEFCS